MSLPTKITRILECVLTEEEIRDKGRELAHLLSEKAQKEANLKSVQAQYKSDITSLEGEISKISGMLNSGVEHRDIECEIAYDFIRFEKSTIRKDTGEIIKTEPLSEYERQTALPIEGADEDEAGMEPEPESEEDENGLEKEEVIP